jgi:septum formation topological specificity factor MinE
MVLVSCRAKPRKKEDDMGITPHNRGITIGFDCQFEVQLKDSRLSTVLAAFSELLSEMLTDFIQKVLVGFGEYAMTLKKKPFACECCGNGEEFTWKTKHGKATTILTIYRWVVLKQLQVLCKKCGHKFYITRSLLGIEPRKRIPAETYRKLGLLGSLTTYRVAEKIGGMFGWAIDKMTVWKAVQKTASEIEFKLDGNELPLGEADGTGVGITGIAKRGKELKVFVQYKKSGGVRVAGLDIGNYNGSWDNLFKKSLKVFKGFKQFLLLTDGDTSILDGLKGKVKIIFQRCLWHIPYQAKYVLWQDKVKHKSSEWLYVVSELMEICALRPYVDCKKTIQAMIASKKKRLDIVIAHCRQEGYTHTVNYLENARPDLFTAVEKRLNGKTTSRVERLMRTANMRVNVSKWSEAGALNVTKVRLAYYYNGFDA